MATYQTVDVTPTIDTNAYTAEDVVGGLLTFTFNELVNGGAKLAQLMVIDDDNEKAELDVYFFDNEPSAIADDAAFAPTVADLKKLVGFVTVAAANYTTVNSNAWAIKSALGIELELNVDSKVYAYVVCAATPTYTAATDLTFRLTASEKP